MKLVVSPDRLAVCRLERGTPVPAWVPSSGFVSITSTREELSIICAQAAVPDGVRAETGFRLIQVVGPLPFEAVGIIAGLTTALGAAKVSVLPVSTFDTDYLLVHERTLPVAVVALRGAGHEVDDEPPPQPEAAHYRAAIVPLARAPRIVRQLAGSGNVGVMVGSPEGVIVEANDAVLALVGFTRTELEQGMMSWEAISFTCIDSADRAAHAELQARGVATPYEKDLRDKAGRRVPVLLVPTIYDDASLALWFVIDLTERRRAERALRDSERRFRSIADASPLLVWTNGPDNSRLFVNRRWTDFTGRTAQEELHAGWLDGVHPDDRGRVVRTLETAAAGRDSFRMEYRLRRRDGEYRWLLDYGVPFVDDNGQFGYVGSSIDITDRKTAEHLREEALARERQARTEAERLSRLKDEFLGTLSHELRTPLNAILGWTQVLRRQRPETLEAGLNVIERNARTLTDLVDDLLDVSRIVAGTIRLETEPVALTACIDNVIDSLQAAVEARRVTIRRAIDPSVDAIIADPSRLRQIIWNLLSNAVKFTQAGGNVEIEARRRDGAIEVAVTDTGEGIAPEFLPYVFERFSQADGSVSRIHGGLGLGLAIVRHLVELHGGTVAAESAGRGQGARFVVTLPHADPNS